MSGFSKGGLEERFIIERTDGAPIPSDRRYSLVLDFSGNDPHALVAAEAYAASVQQDNPTLASDIRHALSDPARYATKQHKY